MTDPTYTATKVGKLLIEIARDMMENGEKLQGYPGSKKEGRLRELAGLIVLDAAQIAFMDAQDAEIDSRCQKLMNEIERLTKEKK